MTIESIAESLSPDDRASLLYGKCGVPRSNDEWSSDCICCTEYGNLIALRLAETRFRWPNGVVLSDLGRQVKQYLIDGTVA